MQTRSSDENNVCQSVCLSVKLVNCDKTGEKSAQIFIPYERSFSLVFWEEEWLVGATPSTLNFGQPAPVGAKSPILNHSASAVITPTKKVQLTLIGNTPLAFQWA